MSSGRFWIVSPDPEQPVTPATQLVSLMTHGYYHKFGVFLDYDCIASKQYLAEVSGSNSGRHSLSKTS
jgi:hypothetical protein